MTIYNLNVTLSQLETSPLFLVQFYMMLLDLNTDFSGGRSHDLVFPSSEEFAEFAVIHTIKDSNVVNEAEVDFFF